MHNVPFGVVEFKIKKRKEKIYFYYIKESYFYSNTFPQAGA